MHRVHTSENLASRTLKMKRKVFVVVDHLKELIAASERSVVSVAE